MVELPRLVIAAPASGHGKTTVATGLMAALRAAGHTVSGHKVGPDYIDPGYHALATGRPGRNLDPHLVGEDLLAPLLLAGARGAGIAVVEGVMGLYDGRIGGDGFASTAHVAAATGSPVLLVVDVSHASRTIAAVVQGMVAYGPELDVAGVVLNKAGSERHAGEVRRALEPTGVPVLGVLYRDDEISAPSRHLGLVPAAERPDAVRALDRLASRVAERIDLRRLVALARQAPPLPAAPWSPERQVTPRQGASRPDERRDASRPGERPVVAVAGGRAFTFRYAETEELLRAAGCEVAHFDPLTDPGLPDGTAGLYLGGGFPEVHAGDLAANSALLTALRRAVNGGVPTVAECAGLLYLCRTLDGAPMVGALEAQARMSPRLTLGYRDAVAPRDTLLAAAGERATGHEFHRTVVEPRAGDTAVWEFGGSPEGFGADPARTGFPTVHASYLHTHWAGHPGMARRFAAAARRFAAARRSR
ncbi:cobyrinate a,c-diamide synthase [Actinocorallia libanotica]|uniref:Hydrogenobyrinate a,c-diamide synthase n=1 Tax=Actinocorallia libanotica TaxID=46162 RepID=A0ABN1Q628_9ACTN